MTDFIQGENRFQSTLFPERVDDYIAEDNAVRVIDVFIDELDLSGLGFRTEPEALGRPAYDPAVMFKTLCVRLLEPSAIESSVGTRVRSQCRGDVVNGTVSA